ncbi:hypothetical protein HY003_00075 [Candidatus Saccharibacteria bacterium]|nr:hypothetical protein [Candidatus Saccharibacteria bacterium]MBI3337687.1 hypothetical protein [Candidatus Saccharibacteria bacterium]
MSSPEYTPHVQAILDKVGDMPVVKPGTDEIASLADALPLCVDKEGTNHLLNILGSLTMEEARTLVTDLAPKE